MFNPPDYEESNTQPRRKDINKLWVLFGMSGYEILKWMFANPFQAYVPEHEENPGIAHEWEIGMLARMIVWGIVDLAATNDGFQLTADGRYYVAHDIIAYQNSFAEKAQSDEERYLTFDDYTEWNGGNFDLLDF